MRKTVSGTFEVKLAPLSATTDAFSRMSIDKQFHGGLTASSTGQMMTGAVEENQARVYVAIEKVVGTLDGKTGSFLLAHRGTMSKTGQALSVVIVSDSGTGQLAGISGEMTIEMVEQQHRYSLSYQF